MKSIRIFSTALRCVALGSVAGALVGGLESQAAVVSPYFAMTVTTTSDGFDSVSGYNLGRLNDGYYGGSEEYGAQVTLGAGAPTVLKGISFYYFSDFSSVGGLTYRIYANDGPLVNGLASPGTFLIEGTADITGDPTGAVVNFSADFGYDVVNGAVPTTLTMTLQFSGVDATHHAGWLTSEKTPTVGTHPAIEFWHTYDQGNTWYTATLIPVPEVNGATLVGGVLGLFGAFRFFRRSKF